MSRRTTRGERASVAPLVVVALVVATGIVAVIGRVGTRVVDSARADVHADSSALAAAGGGEEAARAVAEGNGSQLLSLTVGGDGVFRVEVVHRGHTSVAAARLGGRR